MTIIKGYNVYILLIETSDTVVALLAMWGLRWSSELASLTEAWL